LIEDKTQKEAVKELFLPPRDKTHSHPPSKELLGEPNVPPDVPRQNGKIQNLIERDAENKRFGYITPDAGGENIWFGEHDLDGIAISTLTRGEAVTFELGVNWVGPCARRVRRKT
jgi:cold shock CspA family protein